MDNIDEFLASLSPEETEYLHSKLMNAGKGESTMDEAEEPNDSESDEYTNGKGPTNAAKGDNAVIASDVAASNCIAFLGSSAKVPAPKISRGMVSGTSNSPPSALAPLRPAVSAAIITESPDNAGKASARRASSAVIIRPRRATKESPCEVIVCSIAKLAIDCTGDFG